MSAKYLDLESAVRYLMTLTGMNERDARIALLKGTQSGEIPSVWEDNSTGEITDASPFDIEGPLQ